MLPCASGDQAIRARGTAHSQINVVTCASPTYLADHGEPRTLDDLHQHPLLGLTTAAARTPNGRSRRRTRHDKLHFAMLFNSARPGHCRDGGPRRRAHGDLLIAEYVRRRAEADPRTILPGPPISLVYPSAGHQAAKVRVFSDFAADLMRKWNDTVRRWIATPPQPSQRVVR
jgi:LysR family transcriptional regulator for bpeEF and oprC